MREWIISSSLLVAAMLLLRLIFKKHVSPRLRYGLWLIVLLRLLLPVSLGESAASVFNYLPAWSGEQSFEIGETQYNFQGLSEEAEFTPYVHEDTAITEQESGQNPVAAEPLPRDIPLKKLIFGIYALIAGLIFMSLLVSNLRFAGKLRQSRKEAGSFMDIAVYRSSAIDNPCLFGLIGPALYISPDVDDGSLKHVLMHEYAHYCQRDHIWAWLRGLCLALHWYNPLVWLAAKLSKQDGELSCDERVLCSLAEDEQLDYGRTLISLSCGAKRPLLCAVAPLSSKGRALKERVEYVAARPKMIMGHMALLLFSALVITGCTFTGAKPEPESPVQTPLSTGEIIADQPSPTPAQTTPPATSVQLPGGRLLDRNGLELSEENFDFYGAAGNAFFDLLSSGGDLRLTVDLRLQQRAEQIMEENLAELGEMKADACLILIDVKTGEPLLISSTNEKLDPMKVSFSPYDLFLPCTGIAGLAVDIIRPDTQVDCDGIFDRYMEEGLAPQCWLYEYYGLHHPTETLETALRDSCYEYFYAVGNDCGIDDMEYYARKLGLGEATGIELSSSHGLIGREDAFEKMGIVWNIGHTLDTARGRPVTAFTPLQLAQYCSVIANGGTRYSASILYEMSDADGNVLYKHVPTVLSTVDELDDWDWAAVRDGMYENCNFGANSTSQLVLKMQQELGDWQVAGSHGYAARSADPTGTGMFMGFAPCDEPQIAVMVLSTGSGEDDTACRIGLELIAAYKDMY